jgi:hypothetical protein
MGGNALKLKGINPKRVDASQTSDIIKKVQTEIGKLDLFSWIAPVKSYHSKPDHGDFDFVGHLKSTDNTWYKKCAEKLKSKDYYWNRPVISLEMDGIQIDITARQTPEKSKTTLEFCHYSPLGNILGRMIRKTGAKWGVDGLQYPIHEKNNPSSPLISVLDLSNNIEDILKFCGLDPLIWKQGFETQKDIFDYAINSHFFDKNIFLIENLNHVHRKRDQTRPDYHNWLTYIKTAENKTQWNLKESDDQIHSRIEYYLDIIGKTFPHCKIKENLSQQRQDLLEFKKLKEEKFNGHLIANWAKLSLNSISDSKKIGELINEFKRELNLTSTPLFKTWLIQTPKETCKTMFFDFYKKRIDKTTHKKDTFGEEGSMNITD